MQGSGGHGTAAVSASWRVDAVPPSPCFKTFVVPDSQSLGFDVLGVISHSEVFISSSMGVFGHSVLVMFSPSTPVT